MKIVAPALLALIFLSRCIDQLPYAMREAGPTMVVDGVITDDPGPYTVKLLLSAEPSAQREAPETIGGASVWIMEDQGMAFELIETAPGIYKSDPSQLRGEIGKTYFLKILLDDGTEYQSSKEKLLPAGNLDSIYYEYQQDAINQTDPTLPSDAITFYVDARSDPSNSTSLQRWRSTGIYEILTYPELREEMKNGVPVPAPLACSGYVNVNDQLVMVDTCSCCNCWVYEYPQNAVVSSSQFSKGGQHNRVAIARMPVDSWRFFRRYYLEVEQLSISENVYEFWKRVSAQQQGTGSLFQPNAVKVRGNIRSVNDSNKEVFGIFSASSVSTISIFVTRGQLPVPVPRPDTVKFDCRYIGLGNSTNVRPPFW